MTDPTSTPTPDDEQPQPGAQPDPDELAAPANPTADTAGEEDHTDPAALTGDDTDPPAGAVPLDPEGGGS